MGRGPPAAPGQVVVVVVVVVARVAPPVPEQRTRHVGVSGERLGCGERKGKNL